MLICGGTFFQWYYCPLHLLIWNEEFATFNLGTVYGCVITRDLGEHTFPHLLLLPLFKTAEVAD